jgi:hypothetical protein
MKIYVTKNGIKINDTVITKFEIDIFQSVLGNYRIAEKDENDTEFKSNHKLIIWDEYGIYAYIDDLHTLFSLSIEFEKEPAFAPKWDIKKWRPSNIFTGELYITGKSYEKYAEKNIDRTFVDLKAGNYKCTFQRAEGEKHFLDIEINYEKPRVSTNKYILQKIQGEILYFKNFNFKLAVIEELMYTKKLLKPEFDVYDFAEDYVKREIDVDSEGYEIIPEVRKYFQNMEIGKDLAVEIETLDLDGGNTIYGQLCPFWDGEDDLFTIKSIGDEELKQFINLKKITSTLLDENKKIIKLLKKYNIEIIN